MRIPTLIPLALLSCLAVQPLAAQDRLHSVLGIVQDTALKPLAGIEVILVAPRRTVISDRAGRFRIDSVPAGRRDLIIRHIGFLPLHPGITVPQADTLRAILLPAAQNLPPIIVESERPGIRGVVGDTAYHALPGTLVELLGARLADTTDDHGHFAFEALRQGQYVLRVSREGFVARLLSVDLTKHGQEYSIFLEPYRRGMFDWANTIEAANALADLGTRLAMEPRRNRMTRAELARYGTAALCDIPRLRAVLGEETSILLRGVTLQRNANLCAWSADEVDLLEWGTDACNEAWKSIADILGADCGSKRRTSFGFSGGPTGGVKSSLVHPAYVVLWPRG